MAVHEKLARLMQCLGGFNSLAVAFSGGVDSTFLLKVAHDVLGDKVVAVTGRSLSFPLRELRAAEEFAVLKGIRHFVVNSEELDLEGFSANPTNRCYICKKGLFSKIWKLAREEVIDQVIEASNTDDGGDYRPGLQAIAELGVVSPLRLAGLSKEEIRQLSREMELPTWDKPSLACLASRFPYGERITPEYLRRIDAAEQFLLTCGFRQVRVRFHEQGKLGRIEVDERGFGLLADAGLRDRVYQCLNDLGFAYVAVDLKGYRTGSMNETLRLQQAEFR
ncbi:MAG: ATP-dependent sacrificial sulfur transferase LarE [Desulfovibrio sp.]|nr:ATP-dependent sacrificial sulfur transferase LarE [Desulfovibrio sp.]